MNRLHQLQTHLGSIEGKERQFVYTTSKGCLTTEQRQFYEDNGYIVIRDFLKHEDIDRWVARFK